MGVKKRLVQGGTFQNPILFTGSYLSRTPSIPSPGAPGHPARKEASSPPPTPGPSAGNPRTTLGTLTTFLGGWAPPLGLETRLWAYSLPRGTTETPSHWACHPPAAGYPAHGGVTCGAQELLPANPRATPAGGLGRGRPLGRSIPVSPSAVLSVCQVVSVLPTLPGCQHFLEGSEDALVKYGPPRLSHRTTPWWLPWQLWGPVGVAMRAESAKVCPRSCLLCFLSLSFK